MPGDRTFGSKRSAPVIDRRRQRRNSLGIAVSLYSVTQSRVALMIDASSGGSRIKGQNLPPAGKDIILKVGDVELFGRIIRTVGEEAAVEFEQPVSQFVLERLQKMVGEQTEVAMLHDR